MTGYTKIIAAGLFLTINTFANDQSIGDKISKILPGTKIEKISKSQIDTLYEVYLGNGQILYVEPKKELIVFGEIYTKNGVSLTRQKIQQSNTLKSIDDIIEELKQDTKENKAYLSDLIENGLVTGKGGNNDFKVILIKSPVCPHCIELDKFIDKFENTTYQYYSPHNQSLEIYKTKYKIKDPYKKLEEQSKLISQKLQGFGVPFALVLDKDNNLVDSIKGFSEKINGEVWKRYLQKGVNHEYKSDNL